MEPIRPQVDGYLLQWITREPLRREWFFEERNGNCRLARRRSALLLAAERLRYVAGSKWGTRRYLDMDRLAEASEAA